MKFCASGTSDAPDALYHNHSSRRKNFPPLTLDATSLSPSFHRTLITTHVLHSPAYYSPSAMLPYFHPLHCCPLFSTSPTISSIYFDHVLCAIPPPLSSMNFLLLPTPCSFWFTHSLRLARSLLFVSLCRLLIPTTRIRFTPCYLFLSTDSCFS